MDTVDATTRSKMMSSVSGKDTKPEVLVRSALHAKGFRYRLHDKNLPGKPDLVFRRYKIAVFVHGCFWHGHNCRRGRRPSSNVEFWNKKLDKNIARDREAIVALEALGWSVVVIWECRLDEGIARTAAMLETKRDRKLAV